MKTVNKITIAILGIALCLMLTACTSMPPGCRLTKTNSHAVHAALNTGGCIGTSMIKDLHVTGAPSCLSITPDNCNNGQIGIQNRCEDTLVIGDIKIAPSPYQRGLELYVEDGKVKVIEKENRHALFVPEKETDFMINASIGEKIVGISFIRTPHLCEPLG